jgi:hypothetical protein
MALCLSSSQLSKKYSNSVFILDDINLGLLPDFEGNRQPNLTFN